MATIKLPPILRNAVGGAKELSIDVDTVGAALLALGSGHPATRSMLFTEDGGVSPHLNVYVNDADVRTLRGLETPLRKRDTVMLLPALASRKSEPADLDRAFEELSSVLFDAAQAARVRVIQVVGPAGSGKTHLVARAMNLVGSRYDQCHLISVTPRWRESPFDSVLELLLPDQPVSPAAAQATYRELVSRRRLLIALDGVAGPEDVAPLIPPSGRLCIVVTSRRPLGLPGVVFDITTGTWTPHPPTPSPPEPSLVLPGYASDTAAGDDRLGIGRDVDALASLIASRETRPPLSVGLFGDWGAGKSFFIRAIESRVATLAGLSRDAEAQGTATAYCAHVRQITFNAWHFVDANLWASLVSRIWEGLAAPGRDRSAIAGGLASSRLALDELEANRSTAEKRERLLDDELKSVERATSAQYDALEAVRAEDEALRAPRARVRSDLAAVQPQLEPSSEVGMTELRGILSDLSSVHGRLRSLWYGARAEPRWRLGLVLLGVMAPFAMLAGALLLPGAAAAVTTAVAAIGAVGGFAVGLRQPLSNVRAATAWAKETADELQRKADAARRSQEDRLQREIDANRARMATLKAERDQARAQVSQAATEIEAVQSGHAPHRFIAERLASDDYERHLGIMALIRRDFECLSELLASAREHPPGAAAGDVPQIDRVVLYIDDLDRCPTSRVVEMLEAVHLLLAFDLFAVVVAVDARWLLRSLESHYAAELSSAATPQNYLEKIFQIPFAVRPMHRDGFVRMVDSLFEDGDEHPIEGDSALDAERTMPAEAGLAAADPNLDRHSGPVGDAEPPAVELLNPRALRVTDAERELTRAMHPLLRTPRATKRFANTYRLLRASLTPAELEAFAGDDAEFGAAQILLAAMIGIAAADRLFERVLSWPAEPLSEATAKVRATVAADGDDDRSLRRLEGLALELEGAGRLPITHDPYLTWLPRVARYSFTAARLNDS